MAEATGSNDGTQWPGPNSRREASTQTSGEEPRDRTQPAWVKRVSRSCHPGPRLCRLGGCEVGLQPKPAHYKWAHPREAKKGLASLQLAAKAAGAAMLKTPILPLPDRSPQPPGTRVVTPTPGFPSRTNEHSLSGLHHAPLSKALLCTPQPSSSKPRRGGHAPETQPNGLARRICCYNSTAEMQAEPRCTHSVLYPCPFLFRRQDIKRPRARCRPHSYKGSSFPSLSSDGPQALSQARYRPHPCKEGPVCAPFTKEGTEVKHGEVTATQLQNGRPGCNWLAWFQSLSLSIGPVSQ